jgi:hypothetical protein
MIVVDGVSKLRRGIRKDGCDMWAPTADAARAPRLAKTTTWAPATAIFRTRTSATTTTSTTRPYISHNGSRSRSPRGYALCVSAARRQKRVRWADSRQLLKGLQEEGNDPALDLPQAVQGR